MIAKKIIKKKNLLIILSASYIALGIILFFCGSGCNSYYTQEALALRLPFYAKSDARFQDIAEHKNGKIYTRFSYSTYHDKGKQLRILDIPKKEWTIGDWDAVSSRWCKISGKYDKIVEFDGINRDMELITIGTPPEICHKLVKSPLKLAELWNNYRKIILQENRIKTINKYSLGIDFPKLKEDGDNVEILSAPSYRDNVTFVYCSNFKIAAIPWDKLSDNTIIAILEDSDSEGNYRKLYIKHHKDSIWFEVDLGKPESPLGRFALKACNLILFPITISCTIVCDIYGELGRKFIPPPIPK